VAKSVCRGKVAPAPTLPSTRPPRAATGAWRRRPKPIGGVGVVRGDAFGLHQCAITGHTPTVRRMGEFDPKPTFLVGLRCGRNAQIPYVPRRLGERAISTQSTPFNPSGRSVEGQKAAVGRTRRTLATARASPKEPGQHRRLIS
jgi:hypothetical protein